MVQTELAAAEHLSSIAQLCRCSKIGKRLPDALYVHASALSDLEPQLRAYERKARQIADDIKGFTLVKFSILHPKISYLFYENFDRDPHPALQTSIQVNIQTFEVKSRNFISSRNPPILHRKETFVKPDYPHYKQFAQLTHQECALGLLDHPSSIGTRQGWLERLAMHGVSLQGHCLIHQ